MLAGLKYFKKIISSNFTRLRFPHKISYVVTYRCNLRCAMCNIWKKRPAGELGLDEVERFFKKSNSFSWVGITGGEPFLREDIGDISRVIVEHCKELTALHFATNGTMTDKILGTVEHLLKNRKRKIKILFTLSMDGYARLHDAIRGVEGTWKKCFDTFKKIRQIRPVAARIGITISSHNAHRFGDIFRALKEAYPPLRFDDITVNVAHKSSFYYNNVDMPEPDYPDIVRTINEILEMDREHFTLNNFLRRKYLRLYKIYAKYNRCPLKCQALSSTCVLDPHGDIYPCGIYEMKVANIKESGYDLRKIWSLPRVEELSRQCAQGVCPSCWSPCDAYSAIAGSLFHSGLWRISPTKTWPKI